MRRWLPIALLVGLLFALGGIAIGLRQGAPDMRARAADAIVPTDPAVAVERFDRWARAYVETAQPAQPTPSPSPTNPISSAMPTPPTAEPAITEGLLLARQRRLALYDLMRTNPQQALEARIDPVLRAKLPPVVAAELETPLSGMGRYDVIVAREETDHGPRSLVRRFVTVNNRQYEVHTFGNRLRERSLRQTSLHGMTVGDRAVISPQRLRVLQPGEQPTPGKKVADKRCPVSGKPANPAAPPAGDADATDNADPDPEGPVTVESGDTVYHLCSALHVPELEQQLAGAETGSTGDGGDPLSLYTEGAKSILYIRIRFSDQTGEPQSLDSSNDMLADTDTFMRNNSYGKTSFTPYTVTPVYTLPNTAQWYKDNDTSGFGRNVLDDGRAVAANPADARWAHLNTGLAAYNYTQYTFEAVRYSGGPGSFSGQAYVGSRGCWMKSSSTGVAAHEFGHNLGLWHANYWDTTDDASPIGPGSMNEYGDSFDTMGSASAGSLHFNTSYKYELNWLVAADVTTINASGLYRVYRHDHINATGIRALKVARSPKDYWIEYRQLFTSNQWMTNGASIRWKAPYISSDGSHLLDMTPGSPDGKTDSPLVIGQTFSDKNAGIHITPVARGGTSPSEWLDVQVNLGNPTANNAPTLDLTANPLTVAPGQQVAFQATAVDSDGDTLYYHWDFADRSLSPNQPTVSKSFSAAGQYRVRCTVSDAKGKTTSKSIIITVGTPSTFTLSGRVLDLNGAPVPDALVTNNLATNNTGYRYARTDSDGTYALVNIPAGTVTLVAFKEQMTLTPDGFTNPITVDASRSELNFLAEPKVYKVSGTVKDMNGNGVANALVTDGTRTERTASNGTFTLYRLDPGSYTLAASKQGYVFNTRSITVDNANLTSQDIFEQTTTLSGTISVLNVAFTVTDGTRTATSATSGSGSNRRNRYSMTVPRTTLNLVASATGYSVVPSGFTNPLNTVTTTTANFTATADATPRFTISGTITDKALPLAGTTVTIASNGNTVATATSDGRGLFLAGNLPAGTYTLTPVSPGLTFNPVSRNVTITSSNSTGQNFATTRSNTPPTFTVAAAANPNPVVGNRTLVSALATDDGGDSAITYQWSTVSAPTGGSATFEITAAANAAQSSSVTFNRAGVYRLRVTARDTQNASATSDVYVTVEQVASGFAITPANTTIALGQTQQFTANTLDQFGQPMTTQPAVTWSVSAGASISTSGLFAAAASGVYTVTAESDGRDASTLITVGYPVGPGTGILRETFTGISGTAVSNLTSAPAYIANTPATTEILTTAFEAPTNYADNYGQRLRGYFIAPVTGTYRFVIASDDSSELWLSTSDNPANKARIASVSGYTGVREWAKYSTQLSAQVSLVAGQRYYIEALHKEGGSGDNLAVGVDLPGGVSERPIPGHRLDPWTEIVKPTVTIAASDPAAHEPTLAEAPAAALDSDSPTAEHPGHADAEDTGTFTVTRSGDTTGDLIVRVAITGTAANGTDYTSVADTVTIPAGQASANITVAPLQDGIAEGAETVIVTLAADNAYTVGTADAATVTIGDADPPVATIAWTADAAESGPTPGMLTLTYSYALQTDTTVNIAVAGTATSGDDYAPLPATVTMPAGQTSVPISVTPVDDNVIDADETVAVQILAGAAYTVGASDQAEVTIVDNDQAPVITTPAAGVVNGAGTAVSLTVAATDDRDPALLTYTWSATGPAAVTFSPNGTNAAAACSATVAATGQYTFMVTVADAQGLTATSSVVVNVGQVATSVAVTPDNRTVVAGNTEAYTAAVADQFGQPMAAAVDWSATGGTISSTGVFTAGAQGGTFAVTATAGAASGQAAVRVFPTTITGTEAGDDITLRLAPDGLTVQVWIGPAVGDPTHAAPLAQIPSLTFNTGNGDDTLTVDCVNGTPFHHNALTFTGGEGNDRLVIRGASASDALSLTTTTFTRGGRTGSYAAETVEVRQGVFTVSGAQVMNTVVAGEGATVRLSGSLLLKDLKFLLGL